MAMTKPLSQRTHLPTLIGFIVAQIIISLLVLALFILVTRVNQNPGATFEEMIYQHAQKPFVMRALLPLTVRAAASLIPTPVRLEMSQALADLPLVKYWLDQFSAPPRLALEAALSWLLMFLSLVGFSRAFETLLNSVYQLAPGRAAFFSTLALLGLPLCFNFGYIYDFPSLFLFCLQFALFASKRWTAYLLLFPLTCINKETAILLPLAFGMYALPWSRENRIASLSKNRFTAFILVQVAIWLIVHSCLELVFANNPGSIGEIHLYTYAYFINQHPIAASLFGLFLGMAIFLMFWRWQQKPVFLLRAAVILIPLGISYVLFGFPFELRVFYEAYAIILALMLPIVGRKTDWQPLNPFSSS